MTPSDRASPHIPVIAPDWSMKPSDRCRRSNRFCSVPPLRPGRPGSPAPAPAGAAGPGPGRAPVPARPRARPRPARSGSPLGPGEREQLLLTARPPRRHRARRRAADRVRGIEGDLPGHQRFPWPAAAQRPPGRDQFPGPARRAAAAVPQERRGGGIARLGRAAGRVQRPGQAGQLALGLVEETRQIPHLIQQRQRIGGPGAETGQLGQHPVPRRHSRGTHNRMIPRAADILRTCERRRWPQQALPATFSGGWLRPTIRARWRRRQPSGDRPAPAAALRGPAGPVAALRAPAGPAAALPRRDRRPLPARRRTAKLAA